MVAIALLILLSIGGVSFRSTEILIRDAETVSRYQEFLTHLSGVLSATTDAETGQRGYLITADDSFLEPFRKARAAAESDLLELRRLAGEDRERSEALTRLETMVRQRMDRTAASVALFQQQGFDAARALTASGEGKRIQDAIRGVVDALESSVRSELDRRSAQARGSARFALWVVVVGSLLATGLVLFASMLRRRERAARLAAEAELRSTLAQLEDRIAERTAEIARSRRSLQDSESRLRLALDAAHLGTFDWDVGSGRIEWSRCHEEIWGFAPGEFDGSFASFSSRVHPEDLPGVTAEVQRCRDAHEAFSSEYRLVWPDGSQHWVMGLGEFEYDASGTAARMRGVVMETTARKREEESARRWQRVFESARFGLAYGSVADNTFIEVNEAFARERGYSKHELVGRKLTGVYPPEMWEELFRQLAVVDDVGHVVFDGIHVRKDGTQFPVLVEITLIRDASGRPVSRVAYAVDISDRKRAEELLRQRNEELMRFIYTVSHDLKSPLVTIRTFLGYLERDMQSRDEARVETDLGYIRKAAEKMSDLLDEILELSRVGRKVNPPEDVTLQAIVGDALDLVAGPLAAAKVEVRVTDEPLVLTGDRQRLLELFQNLVDNAVKFMGDQKSPLVEIGAERRDGECVIFVRDNGIGIDARHRDKLFGLFEKLHPGFPGNGVGLAIVKRIVEVHGGRIWAESPGPGHGATFRFTLGRPKKLPTPLEVSAC